MSENSNLTQVLVTAVFAAAMFVLVFAAANSEAPGPLATMLSPHSVEASTSF